MKFITEPIKYKQRYRWRVLTSESPDVMWDSAYQYWNKIWVRRTVDFVLLSVPEVGYFISSSDANVDPRTDIGPYPDLQTCKAVAETFIDLKHEPNWSKNRRRNRGF